MPTMTTTSETQACGDSDDTVPVPSRYWWLKRLALAYLAMIVAALGLRLWWGYEANRRLQAEIERIQAAGEPLFPEDFDPPSVPDERNAALWYIKAAEAMAMTCDEAEVAETLEWHRAEPDEAADQVARLVKANARVFELVSRTRDLPDADFGLRIRSPVLQHLLAHHSSQFALAKLLCLRAVHAHRSGDDAEAIACVGDLLALGQSIDQMPQQTSHLYAIKFSGAAVPVVEEIAPDLDVVRPEFAPGQSDIPASREEVEGLIAELLNDAQLHREMARAVHAERMMILDTAQTLVSEKISFSDMGWSTRPGLQDRLSVRLFAPAFQLDALRLMRSLGEYAVAVCQPSLPLVTDYLRREGAPDSGYRDYSGALGINHILSSILAPAMGRCRTLHYRALAERRMAAMALALRLYELDHSQRPRDASELVPDYLPVIPIDPLGRERSIQYLPNAKPPVLYSVGPDGADEGGAFVTKPAGDIDRDRGDLPFFLNADRPRPKLQPRDASPRTLTQMLSQGFLEAGQDNRDEDDNKVDAGENHTGEDQP